MYAAIELAFINLYEPDSSKMSNLESRLWRRWDNDIRELLEWKKFRDTSDVYFKSQQKSDPDFQTYIKSVSADIELEIKKLESASVPAAGASATAIKSVLFIGALLFPWSGLGAEFNANPVALFGAYAVNLMPELGWWILGSAISIVGLFTLLGFFNNKAPPNADSMNLPPTELSEGDIAPINPLEVWTQLEPDLTRYLEISAELKKAADAGDALRFQTVFQVMQGTEFEPGPAEKLARFVHLFIEEENKIMDSLNKKLQIKDRDELRKKTLMLVYQYLVDKLTVQRFHARGNLKHFIGNALVPYYGTKDVLKSGGLLTTIMPLFKDGTINANLTDLLEVRKVSPRILETPHRQIFDTIELYKKSKKQTAELLALSIYASDSNNSLEAERVNLILRGMPLNLDINTLLPRQGDHSLINFIDSLKNPWLMTALKNNVALLSNHERSRLNVVRTEHLYRTMAEQQVDLVFPIQEKADLHLAYLALRKRNVQSATFLIDGKEAMDAYAAYLPKLPLTTQIRVVATRAGMIASGNPLSLLEIEKILPTDIQKNRANLVIVTLLNRKLDRSGIAPDSDLALIREITINDLLEGLTVLSLGVEQGLKQVLLILKQA
jgi:hypothetical protein